MAMDFGSFLTGLKTSWANSTQRNQLAGSLIASMMPSLIEQSMREGERTQALDATYGALRANIKSSIIEQLSSLKSSGGGGFLRGREINDVVNDYITGKSVDTSIEPVLISFFNNAVQTQRGYYQSQIGEGQPIYRAAFDKIEAEGLPGLYKTPSQTTAPAARPAVGPVQPAVAALRALGAKQPAQPAVGLVRLAMTALKALGAKQPAQPVVAAKPVAKALYDIPAPTEDPIGEYAFGKPYGVLEQPSPEQRAMEKSINDQYIKEQKDRAKPTALDESVIYSIVLYPPSKGHMTYSDAVDYYASMAAEDNPYTNIDTIKERVKKALAAKGWRANSDMWKAGE
ncbi:MAG: hypothetical protein CO103_02090 [Chloroflexi bacterium CG_4_9_14_3_um_filter_45_9]|nr:MAG: hypothetical protein CO103_02090 [Chloroflexi bacterium CG_4_9_14_3_um_filter_45_9]